MEPNILRRGKAFHRLVQADWQATAEGRAIRPEHGIALIPEGAQLRRTGRLDIYVDVEEGYAVVVEIKSTLWDSVKPDNVRKLAGAHRRQVWRYIDAYLDLEQVDVTAAVIYPEPPRSPELKAFIEGYFDGEGITVVWYREDVQ